MATVKVNEKTGLVTIKENNGKKTKFVKMSDAVNFCKENNIMAYPTK